MLLQESLDRYVSSRAATELEALRQLQQQSREHGAATPAPAQQQLVQLAGCPATTRGMRAYIAEGTGPLQDVTAALLAQAGLPDAAAVSAYQDKGAGELFAFTGQLDKVPVLRWVLEADPERPLVEDARTLDHGNAVHAGFLRWNQDHFEVTQTVPAALWPCGDGALLSCSGDRFVTGR